MSRSDALKSGFARTATRALLKAAGYDDDNIADWRPYTWWSPTSSGASWVRVNLGSSKTVEYFAFSAVDIDGKVTQIKLQYSTDGGSTWNDKFSGSNPDNGVYFVKLSSQSAADWRIYTYSPVSSDYYIGVVSAGEVLELSNGMDYPFAPSALDRQNSLLTNESSTGLFLGRSIERVARKGAFNLGFVSPSWIRSTWEPFLDHAELKPFFFQWDSDTYSNEAVFCWLDGNQAAAAYQSATQMGVSLTFNASTT